MKALPQLLSCLLLACVAGVNIGAAWSETQANQTQIEPPKKAVHKPHRKHKHTEKKVDSVLPAASGPELKAVVKTNPYLSPYLPGTSTQITSAPNPYLATPPAPAVPAPTVPAPAAPAPAAPLALAKSLTLATTAVPAIPAVAKPSLPAAAEPAPKANAVAYVPTLVQPSVAAVPVAVLSVVAKPNTVAAPVAAPVVAAPARVDVRPVPAVAASRAEILVPVAVVTAMPATPHASAVNPYLSSPAAPNQVSVPVYAPALPAYNLSLPSFNVSLPAFNLSLPTFSDLKRALPSMPPLADESILPTLKKVYPTGEKPLYVLTFKCPTELVGIIPPPTKALHWLVTTGMDAINSSNLLPFNMQQVCQ